MSETVFLKPGTILVFLVALGVGMGLFNWSSDFLDRTSENSRKSSEAVDCSTLNVEVIDKKLNSSHYRAYIQFGHPVDAAAVTFRGNRNVTRLIHEPRAGELTEVEASMERLDDVEVNVKGCSRVFS